MEHINWTNVILGLIAASGFWAVLKTVVDKQKTAYEILLTTINELKSLYSMQSAEFMKERQSSAEKSAVIAKSSKCLHRFKDPSISCPVEEANEERLENHCKKCEYYPEHDDKK